MAAVDDYEGTGHRVPLQSEVVLYRQSRGKDKCDGCNHPRMSHTMYVGQKYVNCSRMGCKCKEFCDFIREVEKVRDGKTS